MPPVNNPTIAQAVADSTPSNPKKDNRLQTYVRLTPETRTQLRFLAWKRGASMNDLIMEAIDNYLRSQGDTEQ